MNDYTYWGDKEYTITYTNRAYFLGDWCVNSNIILNCYIFVTSPLAFLQPLIGRIALLLPDQSVYGGQVSSVECLFKGDPHLMLSSLYHIPHSKGKNPVNHLNDIGYFQIDFLERKTW